MKLFELRLKKQPEYYDEKGRKWVRAAIVTDEVVWLCAGDDEAPVADAEVAIIRHSGQSNTPGFRSVER
jgi:hypothetical protein